MSYFSLPNQDVMGVDPRTVHLENPQKYDDNYSRDLINARVGMRLFRADDPYMWIHMGVPEGSTELTNPPKPQVGLGVNELIPLKD